jgi:hypothetical protein
VFALFPITLIYNHWKRLVATHGQVQDPRLVAAMTVHGRILTFNAGDFSRYGIEVIQPSTVS